jgi:hypothetical protein
MCGWIMREKRKGEEKKIKGENLGNLFYFNSNLKLRFNSMRIR